MTAKRKRIVLIAGPTASGKSSLALRIAPQLGAEIVSIDSVQVFRGFDIGSAKPNAKDRQDVPHHLIDCFDPNESCNAAQVVNLADRAIKELDDRSKLPLVVAGTTLYVTSLLHGLVDIPASTPELRQSFDQYSNQELHEKLGALDPASAARLQVQDRVRVLRALESCLLTGKKVSDLQQAHAYRDCKYDAFIVLLCWSREALYKRINQRASLMLAEGLLEECSALVKRWGQNAQGFRSLGYAQALECLTGKLPEESLATEISLHTRRFAKRQMTFWRNEPPKRGWICTPTQEVSPAANKNFQVISRKEQELCAEIRQWRESSQAGIQVYYVDSESLA